MSDLRFETQEPDPTGDEEGGDDTTNGGEEGGEEGA